MNHNSDLARGVYYIHPTALVESELVGAGAKIWAFAHILKGAAIGCDCNIGDHCFIEGGVRIGNHVVVKNGVSIWSGVTLEDYVFVGPNAVFTNDLFPRAKVFHEHDVATLVREGASIGANATLKCGIAVGQWAMIGAGSTVTRDVPDFALVYGVPGRQQGWVCACGTRLTLPLSHANGGAKCEMQDHLHASCACGRSYTLYENRLKPDQPIVPPALTERG
jgi:acetyltransferase-like isoleucine patch superfamily enzyme